MASGIIHDWTGLGFCAALAPIATQEMPLIAKPLVIGAVLGVVWLSPDIDMRGTRPDQRWFLLQPVTNLYRIIHGKHRGWSHFPIVGSFVRYWFFFAVMAVIQGAIIGLFTEDALTAETITEEYITGFLYQNWWWTWIGVELTSMWHVLFDMLSNFFPQLKYYG